MSPERAIEDLVLKEKKNQRALLGHYPEGVQATALYPKLIIKPCKGAITFPVNC